MRKIVDDVIAKQRANQNVKALQEYFFQKDTIEKNLLPCLSLRSKSFISQI